MLRFSLPMPVHRMLHLYWRFARGMTLGVRALVADGEGRVFLVKHSYVSGWHLPGGGVETGETMLEALARELREEGNIELTGPPVLRSVHHNRHASRRDHVALYLVELFRQTAPKLPDREIKGAGFFPLDALPEDTTSGTRRRIAEVLGGAEASAWW